MGLKKGTIEKFIEEAGGCAVLDGGFATQLEALGADIHDTLWSAKTLIDNPQLIKQATIPGFVSKGLTAEEGEQLLKRSVQLALESRDKFWKTVKDYPTHKYNYALVAASIGSYGAYLADGSEYSGFYGEDVTLEKLKDFHKRRLQVLVSAKPDLLAFETVPNKLEAQAIAELLDEENVRIPSWICFSSVDGENASSGESFNEILGMLNKSDKVSIVGINCSPPHFIENLIFKFRKLTKKAIAVYPNSGEVWDGKAKKWLPSECHGREKFEELAAKWRKAGASLIGGCCRTTPSTIRAISQVLKR